jgi:hypothetical protein
MHRNDARRAFSCPGGDSFIGGNVISDRFNWLCLPSDLRLKGHTQRAPFRLCRGAIDLMCSFVASGMFLIGPKPTCNTPTIMSAYRAKAGD